MPVPAHGTEYLFRENFPDNNGLSLHAAHADGALVQEGQGGKAAVLAFKQAQAFVADGVPDLQSSIGGIRQGQDFAVGRKGQHGLIGAAASPAANLFAGFRVPQG